MNFKVFVGTLYSGEPDFDESSQAVMNQNNCKIHHEIIRNLPEKEAHNALWSSWHAVQHSQNFDFFVKVDADTVITSPDAFQTIGTLFLDNKVTGIQCPLHDFFSDSLINGMNCFSPKVKFLETKSDLYCDRVDVEHNIILRGNNLPQILNPVGKHCWFTTEMHAFHYGLHRMLKGQHELLRLVAITNSKKPDVRRTYALFGAKAAQSWNKSWGFNYCDEKFIEIFNFTKTNFNSLLKTL